MDITTIATAGCKAPGKQVLLPAPAHGFLHALLLVIFITNASTNTDANSLRFGFAFAQLRSVAAVPRTACQTGPRKQNLNHPTKVSDAKAKELRRFQEVIV